MAELLQDKPWFARELDNKLNLNRSDLDSYKSVALVGAGISGAATAYCLAKRGYRVTVFEENPAPAMSASGNYQGILYGTWSAFDGEMRELSDTGYHYSHSLIRKLLEEGQDYAECGLIQLAFNQQQRKRQTQLLNSTLAGDLFIHVDKAAIERIADCRLNTNMDGLYFPHGMWLNPPSLVNALLNHPNIQVITKCKITHIKLSQTGRKRTTEWLLYTQEPAPYTTKAYDKNKSFSFKSKLVAKTTYLVLCNAHAVTEFSQTANLPLRKIRGQISIAKQDINLKTILCGKGYITPNRGAKFTLGATFKFNDDSLEIRPAEHQENVGNFVNILPEIMDNIDMNHLEGQVNYRTSPYDYFPVVGPIAVFSVFNELYAKLKQDANARLYHRCPYYPNLYLNLAHGAKGILTAPICGEIIADYVDNKSLTCSDKLRIALHPNRFYVRNLIKNN